MKKTLLITSLLLFIISPLSAQTHYPNGKRIFNQHSGSIYYSNGKKAFDGYSKSIYYKNGKKVKSGYHKSAYYNNGRKIRDQHSGSVWYPNGKKTYDGYQKTVYYENGNRMGKLHDLSHQITIKASAMTVRLKTNGSVKYKMRQFDGNFYIESDLFTYLKVCKGRPKDHVVIRRISL